MINIVIGHLIRFAPYVLSLIVEEYVEEMGNVSMVIRQKKTSISLQ